MNKTISRSDVSLAIAELMPNIARGVQLDFFASRAITQTQFFMLVALHAFGRPSMGDLARSLQITLPAASGLVDRLERAGYARRFDAAGDRRKVFVELTPRGRRFVREFQQVMRRRWEEVLTLLDDADLRDFYRVVRKLRDRLHA